MTENMDDEMGLAGAAAEDNESEYIRRICEMDIVSGNPLTNWQHSCFIASIGKSIFGNTPLTLSVLNCARLNLFHQRQIFFLA